MQRCFAARKAQRRGAAEALLLVAVFAPVLVVACDCNLAALVGYLPAYRPLLGRSYSCGHAVYEKLCAFKVCVGAHVYKLPVVKVPVGEQVQHGLIRPCRLIEPKAVLAQPCGVYAAVIAVARGVGRRLAEVVAARPDVHTRAELRRKVGCEYLLRGVRACARAAVAKRAALQVVVRKEHRAEREVVHAAALNAACRFAAVNAPVGVGGVVRLVKALAVVVARKVHLVRAELRGLPRHIVAADSGRRVFERVVLSHRGVQHFRYLSAARGNVRVVNFVAHAPHYNARVIPVAANPRCHVALVPLVKKASVVELGLWALPHIERLAVN